MNNSLEARSPLARLGAAVMVCNPLLLLSPICLLYGIYCAVTAPNLFPGDNGNTIFNFTALALYVLMVCVTSTLLARKRIVPDATMLLILHAILFVAPFILISHGVFLDGGIAVSLGVFGISAGLGQLEILRRRLPDSFISPQLMAGGALILAANFAAPMLFRHGLENDNETWTLAGAVAWNLVLPLLAAGLNLIPARSQNSVPWSRAWFGLLVYFVWLAGTAVQLWTVAYVDDRALRAHQFTVPFWVLAWTAFRHARILGMFAEKLAPAAALFIPVAGALAGLDPAIASALFALNLPLLILARGRLPVIALSSLSVLGLICCLPSPWLQLLIPGTSRLDFVFVTLGGAALGYAAILRDARAGFLGAIGVALAVARFTELSPAIALNAAVLFLFLHQLRWLAHEREEQCVLALMGVIWIVQTIALELRHDEGVRTACMVATIVAALSLRNASLGLPTSLIPAVCSIIVLSIHPAFWSLKTFAAAPSGVLPIAAGFAFLTAGAWRSLRKTGPTTTIDADP